MELLPSLSYGLINTLIYALLGLAIALLATKIVDWITPGHLYHQLTEERNMPLAIFTGLFVLGICIIIAASISG